MFILLPVSTQTLMYVLQREQKELSASKAVVKDQSKESNKGKKPVVKKQEGGTIYIVALQCRDVTSNAQV